MTPMNSFTNAPLITSKLIEKRNDEPTSIDDNYTKDEMIDVLFEMLEYCNEQDRGGIVRARIFNRTKAIIKTIIKE
jgi:hypothetical protein